MSDRLQAVPHRFDGLHALRLAELGTGAQDGAPPAGPMAVEAQRGLAFAAAPVASVRADASGTRVRTAFLGLTGPLGVLPQVYSEMVQAAARLRNTAFPAFLDLFNQRLTTLFLRAAEKYRLPLVVQRSLVDWPARRSPGPPPPAGRKPGAAPRIGTDPVSGAMLAVAGLGTPLLRNRMAIADEVVLYYAGLFAARTRPAASLEAMLADYLRVEVRVEQFSGRWLPVAAAEQTRLAGPGEPPQFGALGVDTVAGARVWDVQGAFRIVVGPVRTAQMLDLMPDQPLLRRLVDLVRVFAGADLAFDVQVILHRDCVPDLRMDPSDSQSAPRLGWNTWAKNLPALDHSRDIILDPDMLARLPPVARPPARPANETGPAAAAARPSPAVAAPGTGPGAAREPAPGTTTEVLVLPDGFRDHANGGAR